MPRLTYDLPRDVRLRREAAQRAAGVGQEEEEVDEINIGKSVARLCYMRRYALDVAAARAIGCTPLECMSMSPEAKAWHEKELERGAVPSSGTPTDSSSSSSSSGSSGNGVNGLYVSMLKAVGVGDGNAETSSTTGAADATKAGHASGPGADPCTTSLYFVFTQLPDYSVQPTTTTAAPSSASWPFSPAAIGEGMARQGAQALRSPSACADLVGWGHSTACR
jgi:hypothetical protein